MSITAKKRHQLEQLLQQSITSIQALQGRCVAQVYRLRRQDGSDVVVKYAEQGLDIEAKMLQYLAQQKQPVPHIIYHDTQTLLLSWIANSGHINANVETHAAQLLCHLHQVSYPQYGFAWDTCIGGLHQPNQWQSSWLQFYAQQRLMYMENLAYQRQKMPKQLLHRVEILCAHLKEYLHEPTKPSLIHGDIWEGNILCQQNKVVAWIDPAIYTHPTSRCRISANREAFMFEA
ncbi:MAG: fructosamine kinase family protein [Mariprofundaceae bacterium]|nr:fructosamine kinase family protein [Mariprofundaceae bacterium]